jgi:two-component system, OmpR family, sensor histidine kinase KdpD
MSDTRGKLKIYIGYAAGVGKTWQMLDDAQRLRAEGVDAVIGYFEPHGRLDTIAKTEGLEIVPRRKLEYRGAVFEDMDTDAVIRRHPAVCLVDEFAHTNVPGSERLKRWQDIEVLLDNGINVWTTVNVQHLESLNDQVFHITGVRVRETVPDWVVDAADEIVMVDLTPRALRNRLDRGVVYAPAKARQALENFFTEGNLGALREMALRHTAHEVEERLSQPPETAAPATGGAERILICLTERPASAMLIRRGKRVADYIHGECIAVYVARSPQERTAASASNGASGDGVERHLRFARDLHIRTEILYGRDVARAIVDFARAQQITQVFMGRPRPRGRWDLREGVVERVVRLAKELEITVVAERRR